MNDSKKMKSDSSEEDELLQFNINEQVSEILTYKVLKEAPKSINESVINDYNIILNSIGA